MARGGIDGANITYNGIMSPNIGTSGYNFYSVYEYICLEDMIKTCEILISIINYYDINRNKCECIRKLKKQ